MYLGASQKLSNTFSCCLHVDASMMYDAWHTSSCFMNGFLTHRISWIFLEKQSRCNCPSFSLSENVMKCMQSQFVIDLLFSRSHAAYDDENYYDEDEDQTYYLADRMQHMTMRIIMMKMRIRLTF